MVLSQSIIIKRTAADVFKYYADFGRHKEFIDLLESTEIDNPDEPFGLGSEFVENGDMIVGGKLAMRSKITCYEENERITCISIDGGNQIEQDFQIQPMSDESCKIIYTTKVIPPEGISMLRMATGALSPFLKSKVKRQMEKDVQKFKSILESGYDKR